MRLSAWVRTLASITSLIYVIHIDAMPQYTEPAKALLLKYRTAASQESGCKRVEVLQQLGHTNHFTLVEQWQDQSAYDQHVSDPKTRDFREALDPMLGAPFDERPHLELK